MESSNNNIDYQDQFFIGYAQGKCKLVSVKDSLELLKYHSQKNISLEDKIDQYSNRIFTQLGSNIEDALKIFKEMNYLSKDIEQDIEDKEYICFYALGFAIGYYQNPIRSLGFLIRIAIDLAKNKKKSFQNCSLKTLSQSAVQEIKDELISLIYDESVTQKNKLQLVDEKDDRIQENQNQSFGENPFLELLEPKNYPQGFEQVAKDYIKKSNNSVESYIKQEQNMLKDFYEQEESKTEVCSICMEEFYPLSESLKTPMCYHTIHFTCLSQQVKIAIKEKKFPVRCPQCNQELPPTFIQMVLAQEGLVEEQMLVTQFDLKRYIDDNPEELIHCLTPDCDYVVVKNSNSAHFACEKCKKEYCLKCKKPWHAGQTCEEKDLQEKSKDESTFIEACTQSGYQRCKNCKRMVEKTGGCLHITCKCKAEFCYRCGTLYKNGKKKCKC